MAADEIQTTTPGDGSKNSAQSGPTPPAPSAPEPEPIIIEEVIIKPASKKAPDAALPEKKPDDAAPTLQPVTPETATQKVLPASLPEIPPASLKMPEPQIQPTVQLSSPKAQEPQKTLAPAHVPTLSSELSALSAPVTPPIVAPAPPLVPTPPRAPVTPPIPAPNTPLPLPPPSKPEVKDVEHKAMENLLEEIKLPERRSLTTEPTAQKAAPVFDTKLGATATSLEEQKQGAPTVAPSQATIETLIVSPLRTLKQDLQDIVQLRKISLVRAVALEQEKKRGRTETPEVAQGRTRRTRGILFATILLLLLGGAALFGVYLVTPGSAAPSNEFGGSILFSENTVSLPLTATSPLELKRLLAQARITSSATLGSITRVVPTKVEPGTEGEDIERAASLEEFMQALGSRASADLMRALGSDFFFGIHTVDENAPLLVIPVLSYERAFAGMLEWEETINADLAPAFTPLPLQVAGAGGLPEKRRFEDVVMRNYDVRALKDDRGEIQLYYSFPTRSLLVIGESPYSFTEILSRLRAERKL